MTGSPLTAIGARALRSRRLTRAPIWLYRHRLGWLLGHRMLMLEHLGRRTGHPRYVCLEVVDRPTADTFVIVSGFGTRAQWYQNLLTHPDCHVSIAGRQHVPARAYVMSATDATLALQRYRMIHPRAWRRLRSVIERAAGCPVTELPMLELRLAS